MVIGHRVPKVHEDASYNIYYNFYTTAVAQTIIYRCMYKNTLKPTPYCYTVLALLKHHYFRIGGFRCIIIIIIHVAVRLTHAHDNYTRSTRYTIA